MRLTGSELRLHRVSIIAWTVAMALLILMIVAVYPSVRGNTSLNEIYANMPASMQGILGGSDLVSPAGYLSTQLFSFFLPAILLVFAVGRGAATLAGEEQDRTLDLLLAQPLPRWSAYLQKALALTVGLAILGIGILVPLVAFDGAVQFNLGLKVLAAVVVQTLLFCLALALWSQAISAAAGRRVVGVAAVTGYAVVSYFVYGLSSSIEWLRHLRPLTLWRWSLGNDPLTAGFGAMECLVLVVTGGVAVVVGLWAFNRRDLHA